MRLHEPPSSSRFQRAAPSLLLAAAAAASALMLSRFNPSAAASILPPCPFYWLTGLYCPGCGCTRALHALLHGDIAQAWAMNPLLVSTLPLIALMALNSAGWRPRNSDRLWHWLSAAEPWLWTLLGYWVLRNLPWWPFAWMAPG